jgi:hypothetical protein
MPYQVTGERSDARTRVYDPTHAHGVADPRMPTGQGLSSYQPFGAMGGDQTYNIPVLGDVVAAAYTGIGIYGALPASASTVRHWHQHCGCWRRGAHSHGLDLRLQYVDVIIASKN